MQTQAKSRNIGGYHRTDRVELRKADPEHRLDRLKVSVNAACTAFFARRGMEARTAFNHWPGPRS
jgi:hypothetical protein